MTLTHILPSLRRSLPNPFNRDHWPEFTTTSTTDVTIAGVSLVRLADWCGTPCVHTAAAVIPNSGGMASPTELVSVIVARVIAVFEAPDGSVDAWIDARFCDSAPIVDEARLVGRVSTARDTLVRINSPYDQLESAGGLQLCGDLAVGDLIAIPCRGVARLHDIDPDRHRLMREDDGPTEAWVSSHCGR